MNLVVFAVGVLVIAASLAVMLMPQRLMGLVDSVLLSNWRFAAALGRLMLGALFIAAAPDTHWPLAVEVIGWMMALAGLFLFVIPLGVLERMTDFFTGLARPLIAAWGLLALAFGVLVVYASWPF